MHLPLRRALLVLTAVLSGSAVVTTCLTYRKGTPRHTLPAVIRQCEQGAEYHCGRWTLVDGARGFYRGEWDQGTRAHLRIRIFDGDRMEVHRVDREGPSVGITALYRVQRRGRSAAAGTVT